MEVFITRDIEHVRRIYSDEEILGKVYVDRAELGLLLFPNFNSVTYISAFIDGEQIGLFELHPKSNSTGIMHGALFKKYRKKYAKEFTERAIQLCFDTFPLLNSIIDETPTYHQHVINFLKKLNFDYVGTIKQNVSIHGILYDTIILQRMRNKT